MSLVWAPAPSSLAGPLDRLAGAAESGIHELADSHASRAEATMKAGASWNDRTTHARQGLTGQADGTDIYLFGVMDYNPYLEAGTYKMDAFPIIEPTAMETAPAYFSDAGAFVMALLGGG
ncbi:MAG: hypothetical protein WBA46_04610 [Thermomicrobiales bacterium]